MPVVHASDSLLWAAQAACDPTESGLPSQDEFLAAAQGAAADPQPARPTSAHVPTCSAVRKTAEAIQEVGAQQLNAEQRWAVASFLDGAGGSCPYTLFGPPGTGKTVTLVECALQVQSLWGPRPDPHRLDMRLWRAHTSCGPCRL